MGDLAPGHLAHRAEAAFAIFLALGNACVRGRHALYVQNPALPLVRDVNHVRDMTCASEAELDALLADVDRVFADFPHRAFAVTPFTAPAVTARLAVDDFLRDEGVLLCLEGELRATPQRCDIRLLETTEHWRTWEELNRLRWEESFAKSGESLSPALVEQLAAASRARVGAVRYWGAFVDGALQAYFSSWPGIDGLGIVDDLYTHPDHRHQGIATALIAHAVADARARGAGPCVIPAELSDTPKDMYVAMGFRPLTLTSLYYKEVGPPDRAAG